MSPFEFFRQHAGASWRPSKETRAQGIARNARSLAAAESWADRSGVSFLWEVDPECDSSEWSDELPAYVQWQCVARDKSGRIVASLHCIDFGDNGGPHGDPYARVVQAELALQARAATAYERG